ncbi:MAG: bifunctional phosphoribosylaminoimidazolecarboxamide formyltransferase/IMP cyclohydrolase [Phycisphaerales bacterium]|nr:bifunctional phosphoribosylaminoimidazolecarboxamide formyltransferase/IMP cyclohydrolase [Phycisphaerales bacterium]
MSTTTPIRRALLSVSDKHDLVPFARGLHELGIEIVSTGGTAAALRAAGIEVIPIDAVTGFPEMMDGRVKTLHPAVHGAILGRRDLATHRAAMATHDIVPIDLVCINLYPFERTVQTAGVTAEEAIEQIDIGGPALLRSAAKNHAFVTVVTSPSQYDRVVNDLRANDGATSLETRRELAAAAFTRTAEYDTNISAWMSPPAATSFPPLLRLNYTHQADLRYGENPHQAAALYLDPASREPSVARAELLHGKPLSYNNLNDAAAALRLLQDLTACFPTLACAAVIKHTNPCGAAARPSLAAAFEAAYAGDPLAAFGGILAVGRVLDAETADAITAGQKFIEVVVAPGYDADAVTRLADRWKNVRLLNLPTLEAGADRTLDHRAIAGGLLVQERDTKLAIPASWTHAAGPAPTADQLEAAAFAWMVTKHLSSNAIAIADDRALIGAGAGQVDRVGAARVAVEKAGPRLAEAAWPVAASDAFFPFADGPRLLADAGVRCIVQPGGSRRDDETIALCDERSITCLLTGVRHFRH